MENFVTCQKRMRAVDGKQEIYLEWPNWKAGVERRNVTMQAGGNVSGHSFTMIS